MSYDNIHRFLLRSVASLGVLSFHDTEEILSKSFPETEFAINDLVQNINEKLKPLKQQIKIVNEETTMQKNLVFISLGCDITTKTQNMFSSEQLDYFRILLEQIMTTESRQITAIQAINLAGKGSVAITDAEALLLIWCRMHYLEKIGSNYAIGLRAIHEFERYFQENMPDRVPNCCLCNQSVFRGYNCPGCDEAIHTNCLKNYSDKHHKWPCCKADFYESHLERLDCQGMSQTLHSKRQTQGEPSNVSNRTVEIEDSDQETEETTVEISQSKKRKRKTK
ncbi:uncharacterized protein LOC113393028 [Vanessa tameamea]|uniref:Non-structural maintenance of chromosomes element 1 homolog n=1 Tax=Vanessa tameamea TaxID=334116 RepID=A0A8B8HKZ1_VANTA|nr:uncharacterized protein LOC113393028 isoform X2 [Vanessa tameamea]